MDELEHRLVARMDVPEKSYDHEYNQNPGCNGNEDHQETSVSFDVLFSLPPGDRGWNRQIVLLERRVRDRGTVQRMMFGHHVVEGDRFSGRRFLPAQEDDILMPPALR